MDQVKEVVTGVQIITILEVLVVVEMPINLSIVIMVDMDKVVVVDQVQVITDKVNQLVVIQIIGVNNNKMVGQHNNNNGQVKVKQL